MKALPRLNPLLLTIAAISALAASLALAPRSDAAIYCVGTPSCPLGIQKPSLQEALKDADFNGQADTILIGASFTPHTGKFEAQSSEKLTIDGAGPGQTVLQANGETNTTLALTGNADALVTDLTLRVKDASGARGLLLEGATAKNVRIEHSGSLFDLEGVELRNASFEGGVLDMNGGRAFEAHETGNSSAVRDTTVRAWSGVTASNGASVTIARSRLRTERSSIQTDRTSTITIDNSVLRRSSQLNDCTVFGLGGTIVANHLTVIGSGYGYGICSWASSVWDTSVTLTNSIVFGNQYDLARAGEPTSTANLAVQFSRFATVYNDTTPPQGSLTNGAGNVNVAPPFVDAAAGDYRLKAPSPLIDAGDPADQLTLDVDRLPRRVSGGMASGARSDMGAHEYQRQAPSASATVPASATVGEIIKVSGLGSDPDPGETVSLAWAFGDGGTATGSAASHAYAAPGTYQVKLIATDASGLQAIDNHAITVAAPPTPTPPTGGGGSGGSGAGGGGAPGADGAGGALAPTISLLRVQPGKRRVRISLSQPATVTLTFLRLRKGKRPRAAGRMTVSAPAGDSLLRIRKRLAPGRYRIKALASDASGNEGAPRVAKFRMPPTAR